jgi:hypothetical protein
VFGEGADGGQGFEVGEGTVEEGVVSFAEVGAQVGLGGRVGEGTASEIMDDLFDKGV